MSNTSVDFNPQDVKTVANELIWEAVYWDNSNETSISCCCGYACRFCDADLKDNEEDVSHLMGCPVLVAQDLLTGI